MEKLELEVDWLWKVEGGRTLLRIRRRILDLGKGQRSVSSEPQSMITACSLVYPRTGWARRDRRGDKGTHRDTRDTGMDATGRKGTEAWTAGGGAGACRGQ